MTTTIPENFRHDGRAEDHPQLERDRFWYFCQQDRKDRVPFDLLPWPTPEQAEALLEAVGWTHMRTARMFHVPGHVVNRWLSQRTPPTSGDGDYFLVGAQAGWTALAYATGLPPAGDDDGADVDEVVPAEDVTA